ncbi:MAG TPA: transcriptional repressor [Dehalococcoidia bacterium]|nr:transcriptional repressor [Dehalococcoidia bacterium]
MAVKKHDVERNPAQFLQERGFRLTPQRLMILAAITESQKHISAEEIYARVSAQYPQVNISTVYRTLALLKEQGLVTETDLGEGRVRYHAADKGHHHHLVCQSCGAIFDLDEALLEPLERSLLDEYNFEADIRHLAIFGRCSRCRQRAAPAKGQEVIDAHP